MRGNIKNGTAYDNCCDSQFNCVVGQMRLKINSTLVAVSLTIFWFSGVMSRSRRGRTSKRHKKHDDELIGIGVCPFHAGTSVNDIMEGMFSPIGVLGCAARAGFDQAWTASAERAVRGLRLPERPVHASILDDA